MIDLNPDRAWAKLLSVTCSLCTAEPGGHCTSHPEDGGLIHEVRIFAARKAWQGPVLEMEDNT